VRSIIASNGKFAGFMDLTEIGILSGHWQIPAAQTLPSDVELNF
jgi:hypothetical protein